MRDLTHVGGIFGSAIGNEQNVMEEEQFSFTNLTLLQDEKDFCDGYYYIYTI